MAYPTEDQFKQYGMTDLSELTPEVISQLESDEFEILVFTKDTSVSGYTLETTATPKPQLALQEEDAILPAPVKSFTLTAAVTGTSVLKVIASVDSGASWKAYDGHSWIDVNINDLSDVSSKGMTPAFMNGLSELVWKPFIKDLKIRFGYYLDMGDSSDTLAIQSLAYETVPVVDKTPLLKGINISYQDLTVEGRLKDLERLNTINFAKLNFKTKALMLSEKYHLHDMVVDTCVSEEMATISASGASTVSIPNQAFKNPTALNDGTLSELDLSTYKNIQKIEV